MKVAEPPQAPGFLAGIVRSWMGFWFSPGSAANLGFCRVIAAGLFFYLFNTRGWSDWFGMDRVLWLPTPLFDALDLRPLSGAALDVLAMACKASLLLTAVGFMTRSSAAIAAVLTFYLLGLQQNVGKIFYADAVVPLILLILAVARSGDRWSLDHVFHRVARGRAASDVPAGEYTWPVRLVWLLTVMIFFAAGIAKLRAGGLEWVFSDQLSDVLVGQYHRPEPPPTSIGFVLAEHKTLCKFLAGTVVALEILSPLALVSARIRAIVLPGMLTFTLCLPVLFGFAFTPHFGMFAFWVPWDRLGTILSRGESDRCSRRDSLADSPGGSPPLS